MFYNSVNPFCIFQQNQNKQNCTEKTKKKHHNDSVLIFIDNKLFFNRFITKIHCFIPSIFLESCGFPDNIYNT